MTLPRLTDVLAGLRRHAASPRRLAPGAVVAAALLVAPSAWAAPSTTDMERVEGDVSDVVDRAFEVAQKVVAARGGLGPESAAERFDDALVHHMLGNWRPAAEGFFVLAAQNALAGTGLEAEAEWYLAESLFQLGADDMAIQWYDRILLDLGHPFRADAVRRLLEIHATDDDSTRFEQLFRDEILSGRVEATDLVLYSVGKALRRAGDPVRAKSYLSQVPPDSGYHLRARYTIGAMLVERGDETALREAVEVFRQASLLTVSSPEDQDVHDLALLAVGRIHDALGEPNEAVLAYNEVQGETRFLDRKLHELAWVFIKEEDWQNALAAVEIFLLAFPEHPYAAELRLVEGHLRFRQDRYEDALAAYEDVIEDFAPIQDRFERLARTDDVGVERMLALRDDPYASIEADGDEGALPPFAVNMLFQDDDLTRAMDVVAELESQQATLDLADEIVAELDGTLGAGASTSVQDDVRLGAMAGRWEALRARLALLRLEQDWAAEVGGDKVATALDALKATRRELEGMVNDGQRTVADARSELQAGRPGRVAQLVADGPVRLDPNAAAIADLAEATAQVRAQAGIDIDLDATSVRIATLHTALERADDRFQEALAGIATMNPERFAAMRDAFLAEKANLVGEGTDVRRERALADDLASLLLARTFGDVADVFAQSVMGADMGVVNVAWSKWVDAGAERKAVLEERNEVLGDLERRYGFLQKKLER